MLLEVTGLSKSYVSPEGLVEVLRDVDIALDQGVSLALTGESGSGKSTLLHLIGGLDQADKGSIKLSGTEITDLDDTGRAEIRRKDVGIIFQQFNLIPSMTVAANIEFHARLTRALPADETRNLSRALGLEHQLSKYPEQLSGGQQQRVAIARTLAAKPKLILADEPTGNLDEETSSEVIDQMLALVKETGAALLLVTHSSAIAEKMDRRLHLSQGQLS